MSMSKDKLSLPQRIALENLWLICRGFAMLPSFIRHGVFANIVYFILCYIVRYRRKVMMGNLERSFPDKSHKEINALCKRAYHNLAEQIINTISMSGISEKELLRRMEIPDAERIRKEMAGQNVVFMMGHYGPWEAGLAISLTFPEQRLVAVYHKLSNRVMDELFKRIRQLPNVDLVDMKRTMRYFIDKRDKQQMIMGLISDQNPTWRSNMPWYKFLHQWTAFFDGAEMLATKYKLPVYYFSPRRVKAGKYIGRIIRLHDGVEEVEPFTITERFVRILEEDILYAPELWMWTHRRWKYTPPEELQSQKI